MASAAETATTLDEAAPADKGRFADLDTGELALLQQKELSRVGCYDGAIDGNWGEGTSAAMESFSTAANLELATDAPSADALIALESQRDTVCDAQAEGDGAAAPKKKIVKQRERVKSKKAFVEPEEPRQKKKVTRTETPKRVIKVDIAPRKKKKIVGSSDSSGGNKPKVTIGIGSGGGVGIGVGF